MSKENENLSYVKLTKEELERVSGGADNGGVILVKGSRKYVCEEPGCGESFDTIEELIRHSNSHYHAVI